MGNCNQKNKEDIMTECLQLFKQLEELSKCAYDLYSPLAMDIILDKITELDEIERIMDAMLEFCNYEKVLILFKKICRHTYKKYPQMTAYYIYAYRDLWDSEQC